MSDRLTRVALRTSLFYAFFALLWVVLSGGALVTLVHDPNTVEKIQIFKACAFIVVTAFLLYGVLRRQMRWLKREMEAREQAEQLTRESQDRFAAIFRSSPVGITLSRLKDGRLVDVNPATLNIVGYSREELMNRSSREVGVWAFPDDRDRLVEVMRRQGSVQGVELQFRKKSGEIGTVLGAGEVIRLSGEDHLLSMGLDITERKRTEENLIASQLRLSEAMDLALIVHWEVDLTTGEFVFNDPFYALYGTTAEKEGGYRMSRDEYGRRFVYPDDTWIFRQAAERRLASREPQFLLDFEHRIIRRDGEVRHILVRIHVSRDPTGRDTRYYGANQDITKRKQAEDRLESTLRTLREAIGGTIQAIVQVVEMRDPYTAGHQRRVADLARSIATEMGLPSDTIEGVRMAAVIHDIGKVSVPAEILSKPGKLTQNEFELVKDHPLTGYDILKHVEFPWPIAEIIYQHHERLDGSGYPRGLKGDDVLLEARIIALADVVEAMASHRPFRPARGIDAALDEIEEHRGTLYDPEVVDTCVKLFRERGYALTDREQPPTPPPRGILQES